VDNVSKAKRSWIMSRIRSSGTKPELLMREMLLDAEEVFTEHAKELPGRPDFKVVSAHTAIFVHGCFFHGCPTHYKRPKSNVDFWVSKVQANMRRDARSVRALWRMGWHVIRVWEHSLRKDRIESTQNRLLNLLQKSHSQTRFTGLRASHGNDSCALGHE
jgi:DNA mismatch endonuclease (patch repair protein)